jgi:glycosyltransferase involved in cell wall biosynthesis
MLVDNASTPRLADVWDLSWHPDPLHIREEELGLTAARLRGIKEASGSLLLFLDDDTVLPPDYLERAVAIERKYPHLGVFGAGIVEPEFEVTPPAHLTGLLPLLALREVPGTLWSNNPKDIGCIPWGGGLCVTRPAAAAYVQMLARLQITHLMGRRGQRLFSGEDDVFSWACAQMGRGFGVFPELRLTHLIRADRLTERYLLRLVHDHAHSHTLINYLLSGEKQPRFGLYDAIRLLLHGVRRGMFSMRCQWAAAQGVRRANQFLAGQGMHPIWAHPTGGRHQYVANASRG